MDENSTISVAPRTAAKDPEPVVANPAPPLPVTNNATQQADAVLPDAPAPSAPDEADAQLGSSRDARPAPGPATEIPPSTRPEDIVRRLEADAAAGAANGDKPPGWDAARAQVMKGMATSDQFSTPAATRGSSGRGRGGKRASFANGDDDVVAVKADDGAYGTPLSSGRGRPRGRGRVGRPRGSRARGGGRGGKRKRDDDDDEDGGGDASDSSDEVTPIATMTKSGRSVQKPTSFVPPPPSPITATHKKKRVYNRRNPESAVCKSCLRGTSPATNMIVFCDGCNAPYHRFCHHPPIDQAVIDEVDREWYCKQCESERIVPVPEAEVADFISGEGASVEQRQKFFASLPPGMLVTLLTKATTLHPDLPVFAPDFKAKQHSAMNGQGDPSSAKTNGTKPQPDNEVDPDSKYGPDVHPSRYPRPGQGLMSTLPPEQEDLQWLVEDDDKYGAFTHVYKANPAAANAPPPVMAPPVATPNAAPTAAPLEVPSSTTNDSGAPTNA